jgi:eukaryotic-like serine/threonine-protein kinase
MSLQPGQLVQGKYRIVRLIGEGGMGAVYEGENTAIGRRVAIKVLHGSMASSPDAVQRFEREARAAGQIGSDHILEVLDLGTLDDGDRFMVLEYLDGETLSQRLKRVGQMSAKEIAVLVRQLLDGLEAAHGAGIIHRDLKPENVFILPKKAGRTDFVKIIDFGISKFNALTNDGMRMTATGAVMGTPYYMSPEQARGAGQTDHRSDLYAVGVILYEAVTGRVPFDGVTFNDLIFKIVLADTTPAREVVPSLDPAFDSIIAKAMSKDPAFRFQSARDFEQALARWESSGAPVTIPPEASTDTARVLSGDRAEAPSAATPLRGTRNTWSQSSAGGSPAAAPRVSNVGLLASIGVGALLLIGVVVFVATRGTSSRAATEAIPTAGAAAAAPQAAAPHAEPAVEPAPAASAEPKIEPAPAVVPSPSAAAEEPARAPSHSTAATPTASRKAPAASPRKAPAATAAAAPAAAAAPSKRRDFGY